MSMRIDKNCHLGLLLWVLLGVVSSSALAQQSSGSTKKLSQFSYDLAKEGRFLIDMRSQAVCRDFRAYLNSRQSNILFTPEGKLIRETDKFTSAPWESLDKTRFQDGIEKYIIASKAKFPSPSERLQQVLSADWSLTRFPIQHQSRRVVGAVWIYRLTQNTLQSVVSPGPSANKWSAALATSQPPRVCWLADKDGVPVTARQSTGCRDWMSYESQYFQVGVIAIMGNTKESASVLVDVEEYKIDVEGGPYTFWRCAFRAPY